MNTATKLRVLNGSDNRCRRHSRMEAYLEKMEHEHQGRMRRVFWAMGAAMVVLLVNALVVVQG